MNPTRVEIVEGNLDAYLAGASPAPSPLAPTDPVRPGTTLTAWRAVELFEDQYLSRSIDVVARSLKKRDKAYYTIASAGHEQNAALGAQLRLTDPCVLHYRSGGLMMARARQLPGSTPLFDTLLSICASSEDPISGGRHKVWGSRDLWVPPQTSTIASHLPKAVGMAFALKRAREMGIETGLPEDALVCCSFGDASANHASALTGINAARYSARRLNRTPILFVCEDNNMGISVPTPSRWIQDSFSRFPSLTYFEAAGEVDEVWDAVDVAIRTCRTKHAPVFLRLATVRLWGHAGTDVETAYRPLAEIEATEKLDPIQRNARRLIELGAATPETLRDIVRTTRERTAAAAEEAATRPKLFTLAQVARPLGPVDEGAEGNGMAAERLRLAATAPVEPGVRRRIFTEGLPEEAVARGRRTLAARINAGLVDEMIRRPEIVVFGEDVGVKGGVYGVTKELQKRFGNARVFDTLLDETAILGVAQGAAQIGLLPIPEIQYLAYLHNAIDQVRGEAASLSFFSNGQFTNPMVIRIAGFAYQRGFGGHFHNDNSIGALREIPGVMIATPARGDDAARLLRGACALAREHGRVVVFLEPIALYHQQDLYAEGDREWLTDYPPPDGTPESALLPGELGVYPQDASEPDLLIASYANGLRLSLRAARVLELQHGIRARVVDLRWLAPLPHEQLAQHARECGRVLVVDECRATGAGIADALIANLAERGFEGRMRSVRAADSFIPLGPAADLALVQEEDIVRAAVEVAG